MNVGIFDLETSSLYADTGIILCGVVKEYTPKGNGEVTIIRADKFPTWAHHKSDNRAVVEALMKALEPFQILVAHNGKWFDKAMLNAKCVKYGIDPVLRWRKLIDPCAVSKWHLRVHRNSLSALTDFLNIDQTKTPIEFEEWIRASHDGDKKAMDKIVRHCVIDVDVLEKVYRRMVGLIDRIDNRGSSS